MSRFATLEIDLTGALDAAHGFSKIPADILQAQRLSLATLRRKLPAEAKRDIGREYNLRASRIAQGLSFRDATNGIVLIGRNRIINAIEYGATFSRVRGNGLVSRTSRLKFNVLRKGTLRGNSGEGAKWAVTRGKPPVVDPGTFIARGKNGALLVFERTTETYTPKSGSKAGKKKIQKITGIGRLSLGEMLKVGDRPQRLIDFAMRTLIDEQKRLLRYTA